MPYGYAGRILHVDLTRSTLEVEEPSEAFYRKYMGGSLMGLYYILQQMPAGIDPLAPENVLTLMVGVTTGAPISGQSRINANAKSPCSGAIGDSQSGGFFPAELKFAGFDGIVIAGRSARPVYLSILAGKPELHDSAHLVGKTTGEVDALLRVELAEPRAEVLQHGPAAERGVIFSSLVSMANRNNGRTGMGLVMASKNLRAIVVRGKGPVSIADPATLARLNKAGPKLLHENVDLDGLAAHGTAGGVLPQNLNGTLPTFNYNEGEFSSAEEISGERMTDTILKDRDTCYACIVRCKRVVEIAGGQYSADPLYGGPEYETLGTFGSYCGVSNLAAIAHANQICNMHGVDTISCGATISFAMECYEKGIISQQETGGMELRFGDAEAMLNVLEQIVTNSGPLGPVLSQGSARAAKLWGPAAEECLITVKNQESPAHMPQAKRSLGLIYAVNPFGADHQSSEHDWTYERDMAIPLYLDRLAELDLKDPCEEGSLGAEKVRFAAYTQIFLSLLDTLELCQFVWGCSWTLYGPSELVEMVRAVTGWPVSLYELMKVGQRRLNLMRIFNAREGFSRKDDVLPRKFFKPLTGQGPTAGVMLDRDEFEAAVDLYYRINDWTDEGIPTHANLADLALGWAAQYLPVESTLSPSVQAEPAHSE
jgi:aldehyde:ferredoxin oxidoreductase